MDRTQEEWGWNNITVTGDRLAAERAARCRVGEGRGKYRTY